MMTTLQIPPAVIGLQQVTEITLRVNGRPVAVYGTPVARYASFECDGAVEISLEYAAPVTGAVLIRPLSSKLTGQIENNRVTFTLPQPRYLRIEVAGQPGLYLFADAPPVALPAVHAPGVRTFAPGQIHDAGLIELQSGDTLIIPAGAVVRGQIHAADAKDIRILGNGVLMGRSERGSHHPLNGRSLLFERCTNLTIEGLCVIGSSSWTVQLNQCEKVAIRHFKCIGWLVSTDGIDIVGSRSVHVSDSLLHDNDDCIAVKGLLREEKNGRKNTGDLSVRDVLIERCVMWNDQAGNAMEIGFETRDSEVDGVVFRDIDVIGAHGEGAVFSIHNGDHATVTNVVWEKIRIEHFYDRFIDFRVLNSRWTSTPDRGVIRDIVLRDIECIEDIFNTPSIIGGWDATHDVENVLFERLIMGGKHILDADALQLFTRHARGIVFK